MKNYFSILFTLCLFVSIPLAAQDKFDRLIISEIYADLENQNNNWIEIYNPTDNVLTLERFRPSNIRTLNVLPKGNYKIESGGYLILCEDKDAFGFNWGDGMRVVGVKGLSVLGEEGGFVFIATKDRDEARSDAVRFGIPAFSDHVSEFFGNEVITFSQSGKSHQRQVELNGNDVIVTSFLESEPSPGRSTN